MRNKVYIWSTHYGLGVNYRIIEYEVTGKEEGKFVATFNQVVVNSNTTNDTFPKILRLNELDSAGHETDAYDFQGHSSSLNVAKFEIIEYLRLKQKQLNDDVLNAVVALGEIHGY